MSGGLVLLRHGESRANAEGRFAGSQDVPLTPVGRDQAIHAGRLLTRRGLVPDVVFSSPLSRALTTARLLIGDGPPLVVSRCLAERRYGSLEGRRRKDVAAEFGDEQVRAWRRGWHVRPPSRSGGEPGESLQDVAERVLPYWRTAIEPLVLAGRCVAVVAHGNSLRVLVRAIEGLDELSAGARRIEVGVPFLYCMQQRRLITTAQHLDH